MPASKRYSLILAALLLLAGVIASAWIRIHVANSDPLWLDELHSAWVVKQPTEDVYAAAAIGNQAPLYFWALHFIHSSAAESPIHYRWISIVCSLLTVVSIGGFVAYWTRSLFAAVLAVWLCAFDVNFIFYGSEARPYTLLMLLAVWQFFAFARFALAEPTVDDSGRRKIDYPPQRNHGWLITTVLLSALLLLTHHTGILLLAAECILVTAIGLWRRTDFRWLMVSLSLIVIGTVVFANQFDALSQIANRRLQWSELSSIRRLLTSYLPQLVCSCAIPLSILIVARFTNLTKEKRMIGLALCVLGWATLPIILACAFDKLQLAPLAMYRYTVVGAVAMPIFAGLCVGSIRHWPTQAVLLPTLMAISVILPIPELDGQDWKSRPANEFLLNESTKLIRGEPIRMRYESWDSVVNLIADSNSQGDIFLFANLLEDELADTPGIAVKEISYLKFPLSHSSKIAPRRIHPKRSQPATLTDDDLLGLHSRTNGECWFVIRGDSAMTRSVENSVAGIGKLLKYHFQRDAQNPEWLTVLQLTFPEAEPTE